MVIEKRVVVFECSFCHKIHFQRSDAERCENYCRKMFTSPEIDVLNLTTRTSNILRSNGVNTLNDISIRQNGLPKLRGMGQGSLQELYMKLETYISGNNLDSHCSEFDK